jgi:hypothetical protein
MSRDPFYEQILAGLNGLSDSERTLFQDCVTDLLRDTFPSLVPVRGGKDSGMDGAIADGKGEPYPLVVTTAKDVERNLKRSLDSWLKRKRPRREAVLATSQALTPERQHKLKDLAQKKGFTLVGLVEQSGIADRLRENDYWRERLLGLTGEPTTLSVVPASRRPLLDIEPIGRDGDIEWLKTTSGDRVLSGAPGSGKTFLLYHLTRQGWGVFVVNPEGSVAKDLRDQRPEVVIVDDAHLQPEFLVRLRHLRRELNLSFSIVATTWEWETDKVIDDLGVSEGQVRKLELLTRNEILEVYRRLGVEGDSDTMRYLIDQAANRPGLAATIGTLWLRGEWQEVIEGKALSRTLLTFFQQHVGPESTDILAAFSLGGDRGVEVEVVREFLDLSRLQIRQFAAGLAAGGALTEVDRDVWAVWPRPLRFALIRTVFFPASVPRHRYEDLIGKVPKPGKAVETLISAKALGASIPSRELRSLVCEFGSARAWNDLAQLSPEDASWVLENYPGDVVNVGRSLLSRSPGITIPRLLERATSATGAIHSQPDHPMRILSDWVRDLDIPIDQMIARRRILATSSKKYMADGGNPAVGIHGIALALSPSVESSSLDPGVGRTVTFTSGILPVPQLLEIGTIWEAAHGAIHSLDSVSWTHLAAALWDWIYPDYSSPNSEVDDETGEVMRAFAAKVLGDLVSLAENSPGLVAGLKDLAARIDFDLPLKQDPDFETLYPPEAESIEDFRRREATQQEGIKNLVIRWSRESPTETARQILRYEEEAKRINRNWPRGTPALCRGLAALVEAPEEWLDALVQLETPPDLVEPFLRRTLERHRDRSELILEQCLKSARYVWLASEIILQSPDPPVTLLAVVLDKVSQFPRLVETLCLRKQVPLSNLRALLEHRDWEIALAAAVGEWLSDPKGSVQAEVAGLWRNAVRRARVDEHAGMRFWLGEIFAEKPELAFDWLRCRLADKDQREIFFLSDRGPFAKAAAVLDSDQRIAVLGDLKESGAPPSLVSRLVNRDPEVYGELLRSKALASFHLEPLAYVPDKKWADLAMLALAAGYDPCRIAAAALYPAVDDASWTSESQHWGEWDEAFSQLEADPREEIQEIAHHGRRRAQVLIQHARERERREEVFGT